MYQEQQTRDDADPLKPTCLLEFVRSNLGKLVIQLKEHSNTLVQALPTDQAKLFSEIAKLAETFLNSVLESTLCEQFFPEWLSSNEFGIELVNQLRACLMMKYQLFSKESIEKLCLQSSSIFFCTVSTGGSYCMKYAAPFDCLIIDEAAQLVEAETAIVACLPGLNHAILVGDHKQLPATVISKVAVESGYGRSLFERMISLKHPCHLLNVQYRMHPSISLFPNTKFYEDRLLNGDNVRGPSYRLHEDLLYGSYAFPCTWTGVTCNTSGTVTGLDLSQRNLSGALSSPALRRLPALSSFNICCNSLSGPLPSPLFTSMPALSVLDVSRNYFIGDFPVFPDDPAASLPSLTFFSAFSNNFTGPIPVAFSHLPKLEHLDLGGSFFDGTIPPSLGNLTTLNYLGLSGNLLTGKVPPELGSLSQLQHLLIGYNRFNGSIPPELGKLEHLEYMDLCCTNLSGPIPPELGELKSLNTLFLYKNSLTGQIPPQLGGMNSLMSLDLSVNNLSGSVPTEFGQLKSLTLLSLMYNNLNGTLPPGLGDLPNLLTLLIWNNSFSGNLPESLGRTSSLQWLDVSSNFFEGSIPPDLCLHSNLTKLIMFSNRLSGPIPESLASCQSLLRVRVQDNQLTGNIPAGFGSLPKLTRLEFQNNKLSGHIPTDISNSSKLNYIDFSFNRITGELPANMWQLLNIQSFLASGNNLTGTIPSDFDAGCASLTVLSLSQNSLIGDIPASLSDCQKLITIQLQQNQLTGSIPPELASVPNLEVLDLSQNYLSGEIPYQFQNLTTLESFNVSYNNLSGPVPLEGMFKTASLSSFLGNPYLCGGMLPRSCIGFGDGSQLSEKGRKSSLEPMWLVGCVFAVSLVILIAGGRCLFKQYGGQFCVKDTFEDMDEWPWRLTAFQRLSFTSNDILDALKDENIVGRGATGTVYKANMPCGEVVAVKKLWMSHKTNMKNAKSKEPRGFQIEVDLLGSIRHRNIVRLLGYCSNNVNTLLVYEYMTNGSLDDALHAKGRNYMLADWVTRYNIAVGIAQGLCYLHHDCFPQVVHRDVKSNNILLDCNMEARVADFGVAKLVETNESMSMIAGSYGYIAPEYAYTLKVDEKTDIYSFGVVLLELLTGRRPIESEFGDSANIVEWVRGKVRSKTGIVDALDANVGAKCSMVQEEMLLVLRIALLCTSRCPRDRPSMRDVVTMLAEAKPRRKSSTTVRESRNGSGPLE